MVFQRNISWSSVLPEILIKIMDEHNLSPADLMRIRWICSSWRAIATKKPHKKPFTLQPPLLLSLRRTPAGPPELGFFNLLRRSFIELSLPASLRGQRCCGCLEGWLIMVSDSALQLSLFHPISGTQVSLPSEPRCFLGSKYENPPICHVKKVILSAPPTDSNCFVAVMVGFNIILLCRPGHAEWAVFQGPLDGAFEDIIFHNGKLCAFASTDKLTIISLDSRLKRTVSLEVKPLPEMTWSVNNRYLVQTADGDLLLVIKKMVSPGMKFVAYKLEGEKWIAWKCPADWCLFVGVVRCELIRTSEIRGGKGNCVFFASKVAERVAPDGVGVYFLDDCKVEPMVIPSDAGWCSLFEPVWVKPTMY